MAFDLVTANNKLYRINRETGECWTYNSFNNQWTKISETNPGVMHREGTETN